MGGTVYVLSDEDCARADKLAAVPAQAWFKSLDKAGLSGRSNWSRRSISREAQVFHAVASV